MLKYLRIAVTVLSLTACVLLIALWVRSYSRWDSPFGPILRDWNVQINSLKGRLFIGTYHQPRTSDSSWNWRTFRAGHLSEWGATGTVAWSFERHVGALGFGVVKSNRMHFVYVPYWFLAALVAAAPWFKVPRHFSLRTLLIAMTLVAVVLGLIAIAR